MSELEKKIKQFVDLLEKSSYNEIVVHMVKLQETDQISYLLFLNMILNDILLIEILQHKVKLSHILTDHAGIEVLDEDNTRVVFTLAKCVDRELGKTNQIFAKEFGPDFQIKENYNVHGKNYSWKFMATKAKEITRAIYNVCYLLEQSFVGEIVVYFKILKLDNLSQLRATSALVKEIRAEIKKNPGIGPRSPLAKPLIEKVKKLYSLTNRLKLDTDSMADEPDFLKIEEYAFKMDFVCSAKIDLISRRMAPNDIDAAKSFLIRGLGKARFNDLISTEELARLHKPLKKKN